MALLVARSSRRVGGPMRTPTHNEVYGFILRRRLVRRILSATLAGLTAVVKDALHPLVVEEKDAGEPTHPTESIPHGPCTCKYDSLADSLRGYHALGCPYINDGVDPDLPVRGDTTEYIEKGLKKSEIEKLDRLFPELEPHDP